MARKKPRVEFDGAVSCVIVRGNQRQKSFRRDRDGLIHLERLENNRWFRRENVPAILADCF